MRDLSLFETLADLEIKALKEKLIEKNKRVAELEEEYAHLRKAICQECQNIGKESGASS